MAAQILSVLCWLSCLILIAAGSLVMNVDPREIIPGLTHFLTIKCSFSVDGKSEFAGLISMIIAKENQQEQCEDLVSANIFRPDEIKGADQLTGSSSVTGRISVDGQSFLAIQWSMPTSLEVGRYMCLVKGVNYDGHPTEKSQAIMVTSQKPDVDQLTDKVSDLQHQLDLQKFRIQNQSETIDTLLSLTQTQSNMISTLLNSTADLEEKLELQNFFIADLSFYLSKKYKGHYYLVSKIEWKDSEVSEQTCKAYGGYLVEINDSDEQEFVENFLESLDGFDYVLISGTQKGHPGNWTYTYSGDDLTYTNWGPGEPDEASNLCIYTTSSSSWQWWDHECVHPYYNLRFMCEVNIN